MGVYKQVLLFLLRYILIYVISAVEKTIRYEGAAVIVLNDMLGIYYMKHVNTRANERLSRALKIIYLRLTY